ncbi:hypothetical protein K458DRAFT_397722 [Lentithecium fluviatile CBS 122367]|uniref:Uncharacterized protein n=1 Tax=Lentithecium fluviatile CBS 122367 TaxID=1168545 RepID=A0A6G1ICI8_9PLEO|nr:hypothetical protein K458DRAFT_397722 [Lentithecium fluviatile CBS 122367]
MPSIGRYITSTNPSYTQGRSTMNTQVDTQAITSDIATPLGSEVGRSPPKNPGSHADSDCQTPKASPSKTQKQGPDTVSVDGAEGKQGPSHGTMNTNRNRGSEFAYPSFTSF